MRWMTALWCSTIGGALTVAVAPVALAAPAPVPVPTTNVAGPANRTSFTVQSIIPGLRLGTPNDHDMVTGLSIMKLYMVDYALRHGDGSPQDKALCERMIRYSDDNAADQIDAKYPDAINAEAQEFHLTSTRKGDTWGSSYTSTADTAAFLAAKQTSDPMSPIFGWMATASPVAADGTQQNWGTVHLPGAIGTKWGWSDYGPSSVASASFGPGFSISAHTDGTPDDENADLGPGLPQTLMQALTGR